MGREASGPKSGGKRDKEGKGGAKKGQEGGKGKNETLREPSSMVLGERTAFPPCLLLPTLIDAVGTGHCSYVRVNSDACAVFGSVRYRMMRNHRPP